jgi:hypothetical protein
MKYTVRWLPGAEQELAALWLDATARSEVTRAANKIDQQLEQSPETLGESRSKALRVHFETPLGILFRVRSDVRIVEVAHVWKFD